MTLEWPNQEQREPTIEEVVASAIDRSHKEHILDLIDKNAGLNGSVAALRHRMREMEHELYQLREKLKKYEPEVIPAEALNAAQTASIPTGNAPEIPA